MKQKILSLICAFLLLLPFSACTTDAPEVQTTDTSVITSQTLPDVTTEAPAPEDPAVTRAEMEDALVAVAFSYFVKGKEIQYDATTLQDTFGIYYGGPTRINEHGAPEEATSDNTFYSVCADFIYKIYEEALGYLLFGAKTHADARTAAMWLFAQKQPDGIRGKVPSKDILLARYLNTKQYPALTEEDRKYGLHTVDGVDMDYAAFERYMTEYREHLRPGDVIVTGLSGEGHAMMYLGNGYVIECSGTSIDILTGNDPIEKNGALFIRTFEDFFLNGKRKTMNINSNNPKPRDWFIVIRPLDLICEESTTGDRAADTAIAAYAKLPAKTQTRLDYPALDIDRTASIGRYGTAYIGEDVTYTVTLRNGSKQSEYLQFCRVTDTFFAGVSYQGLTVTETLPAGLVPKEGSITAGGTYENGVITWTVDLAAGQEKRLPYTVTVPKEASPLLTSGGGTVGNIPSNTLKNSVGYRAAPNVTKDYLKNYPKVSELVGALFDITSMTLHTTSAQRNTSATSWISTLRGTPEAVPENYRSYYSSYVFGYVGGRKYWGSEGEYITTMQESNLQPGDMLVYAMYTSAGVNNTQSEIYLYTGNGKFLKRDGTGNITEVAAGNVLNQAFRFTLFFCLRQSQTAEQPAATVYPVIPATPTAAEARQIVLNYMISMSQVKWTCPVEIDFSKEKSYTKTLYYHAGESYVGLPYVSHHSGIKYFELNFLDGNRNYTGPVTYADMPGVTCAISCYTAFRNVSFRTRGSGTGTITPAANAGMVKVGDYVCTSTNTKTVIEANPEQTIYEAYALLQIGDVLTERQDTGHSRMVYAAPKVVRNTDGTIDKTKSTVALIEQCSSFNKEITAYNTTWKVNKTYTFAQLYEKYYIPSRLAEFDTGLDDAVVTVTGLSAAATLTGRKLSGKVTSNFVILNTLVTVTDSKGTVVSVSEQAKDYANSATSYTVDLSAKDLSVSVSELPKGTYHFRASAFIGYGECILGEFDFEVK